MLRSHWPSPDQSFTLEDPAIFVVTLVQFMFDAERDELSGRSVPVWKEVCRAVKGVLLLHVLWRFWRWQGQLPKHCCGVRRHELHASPAYRPYHRFFSTAPAAVVATPSAVVVPALALSYFLCFPTVSAATALVQAEAPVATLAPRVTSVPVHAVSYTLPQTRSSPLCFASRQQCLDSTLGIMTATPAPVVAAPAPVVEYIRPATFQTAIATMTVTGVDMNRIGIPDVLQQLQVGRGAPVLYGAPVNFWSTSR